MNILFLHGFSNYFNRTVKKYSTLDDYKGNASSYLEFTNINFTPNDGVVTELIVGNETQKENSAPLNWENIGTPDYAVCYEMEGSPAAAVIKFRWFVLESERTRSGQYRLALKRDVVAEHFDTIMESPCFVEKGIVNNINDSILFNNESMTYNQIKTREEKLKDSTGCGWIVGYVPKNLPSSQNVIAEGITTTMLLEGAPSNYYTTEELPFNVNPSTVLYASKAFPEEGEVILTTIGVDRTYDGLAKQWYGYVGNYQYKFLDDSFKLSRWNTIDLYSYRDEFGGWDTLKNAGNNYNNFPTSNRFNMYSGYQNWSSATHLDFATCYNGLFKIKTTTEGLFPLLNGGPRFIASKNATVVDDLPDTPSSLNINSSIKTMMLSKIRNISSLYDSIDFREYNNQIVKVNNKYYIMNITKNFNKLRMVGTTNSTKYITLEATASSGISIDTTDKAALSMIDLTYITTILKNSFSITDRTITDLNTLATEGEAFILIPEYTYSISLSELSTLTLHIADRAYTSRAHTYDSSCDLFAVPYGTMAFTPTSGANTVYTSASESLAIARAIAERYSTNCYDLQLVPYCPSTIVRNIMESEIAFPIYNLDTKSYQFIKETNGSGAIRGFVLWVSSSKDSFNINLTLEPNVGANYSDVLKYKLTNETQFCRLASPNFSGQFEFSVPKNHGISKFNVDYTYKPYVPYIHINPDFNELYLYGKDWDDARGLICGGDFSLAHITSYWQTYQNENKNFQQIFDRQIQNLDINNSIAMEKQKFQATVGTITGGIAGAIGGANAGGANPYTAIAGAIIGGAAGVGLSAYGAQKDIGWLERQQQEARSYQIDMYGYQLGNIQAMPYSIKGNESLTNNNKIWPIVEVYNATPEEVNALISKIKYNGMTIMRIGKLSDYSETPDFDKAFIKGQIIKLEADELQDDFHIADAIYQEINKGIYIPQGGN